MKNQYVILTGSKNNAGDFLIKDRAKDLLSWLRPDRQLIDKDAWRPFDSETLNEVNNSRAVILMGGPALQEKMRPRVYGLVDDLDNIKVPVITMGIGWYSSSGEWLDTIDYHLSPKSLELLSKVDKSGYLSSVRDYHTLNVLQNLGLRNFIMTGCPALYSSEHVGRQMDLDSEIKKVGISLGVSLRSSRRMFKQMQDVVLRLKEELSPAKIVVAFHHGLRPNYLNTDGASKSLYSVQRRFRDWLESIDVSYEDISGDAENLKLFYGSCDLHVGYRVHAHIFMSSISKPSILISEDGRGKALFNVLGGVIFNGYKKVRSSLIIKVLHRCGIFLDNFYPADNLSSDISKTLEYEMNFGVRLKQPRTTIDECFNIMESFIKQLP
jgi:hypothetical protein